MVSDELPQMYVLEGHGETELPETFKDQLEKENVETHSFSLLNEDQIPEDADVIMIYGPTSDISVEEETMLASYVDLDITDIYIQKDYTNINKANAKVVDYLINLAGNNI